MRAEILTTGTELLLGQIDDTNATFLARQLRNLGVDIYFRTTVGDNKVRIAQALKLAMDRADLIITTGGLGPTVDDVTREGVALATDRPLVLDNEMLKQIQGHFRRFGTIMADNNRRQAYLPEGCIPIENPVGTAPGFIVEDNRGTIITLPGVPHEMRYLMEHAVVPYLLGVLGPRSIMVTRILRTVALGESRIDRAIADLETSTNPTVGLSAHRGQTDVRIVAKASSEAEAGALLDDFEARIRERLGAAIYATGEATLEAVVAGLLRERGCTLAVAETHSLGDITQRLSSEPDVFCGGLVAYDGGQLARLLDLPAGSAAGKAGAVALAETVRQRLGATHGLAVLSDEPDGPWVVVASESGSDAIRLRYSERDRRARIWTTASSLDFLRRLLLGLTEGWEP